MIRARILELEKARAAVLAHPMCFRLEESRASLMVWYPEGDFAYGGCRVQVGSGGKAEAFRILLRLMEAEWAASYPAGRAPC